MLLRLPQSVGVASALPLKEHGIGKRLRSVSSPGRKQPHCHSRQLACRALFNPQDDPILKEAVKEPVAFFGGLVAGLLRLDLQEEPLKDWVERTSKAAGLDQEGKASEQVTKPEDLEPTEIAIE